MKIVDRLGHIYIVYGTQMIEEIENNLNYGIVKTYKTKFLIYAYDLWQWVDAYDFKPYSEGDLISPVINKN